MSNDFLMRRSAIAGRVPTIAQCEAGKLAVNTTDKKMYFGTGDAVHELAKQSAIQAVLDSKGAVGGIATLDGAGVLTKAQTRVTEEWNHGYTFATGGSTTLTATGGKTWVTGTTRLYLGGARQQLNVDYTETSNDHSYLSGGLRRGTEYRS